MSTEELRYIGERFTKETGIPASIPGEVPGSTNDINAAILNYPAEILTDPASRWKALENAGALIAEVNARVTGADYIPVKKRTRREMQQIHGSIKIEMERGEEYFGTCRLNPLYQAGLIIDVARSIEGSHIPAVKPPLSPALEDQHEE